MVAAKELVKAKVNGSTVSAVSSEATAETFVTSIWTKPAVGGMQGSAIVLGVPTSLISRVLLMADAEISWETIDVLIT